MGTFMKNNNRKIYLFVVFSYLIFAIFLTLLYIGFINTYIKENQVELVDEKGSYIYNQLSQTLEGDFNYLKTNDSLISFDNLVINKIDVSPLKEIEINNVTYKLIDDYSNKIHFGSVFDLIINGTSNSLSSNQLIFTYDNKIYTVPAKHYLNYFLSPSDLNEIIIMDSSGKFTYKPESITASFLTNYVRRPDDIMIMKDIVLNNLYNTLETKISGKTSFVNIKQIEKTNQYLFLVYGDELIYKNFLPLRVATIISLSLVFVFLVIVYSISVYVVSRKYNDLELDLVTMIKAKPLIISINKKGKIIRVNRTFKKEYKHLLDRKNISDFKVINEQGNETNFSQQKNIKIILDEDKKTIVNFVIIKIFRGYALISFDKDESSTDYKYLALHNQITGLPNELALSTKIDELINLDKSFILIYTNIIDFKSINKLVGINRANELILKIKEIILNHQKNSIDFKTYSIKVDNFAIFIEGKLEKQVLLNFVDTLNSKLSEPIIVNETRVPVRMKFGIFSSEELRKDDNGKKVIEHAYLTSKHAESQVNRDISIYDTLTRAYFKNVKNMEQDMIKGIKDEEFIVYFQPQLNIKTNKIIGFEALVRWNNPKYINESPQKFIELAEENNLIIDIGRQIMRQSFIFASKFRDNDITISLNVSPIQIIQQGFVLEVISLMEEFKITKKMISIEITETFLMESFELVNEKIRQLRKAGILIHLDDFGTGYSSLSYLNQIEFDAIKIDASFIRDFPRDKFLSESVKFITSLGKSLDLEVIAEGVETTVQKVALDKIGVNIIQGYFISKALIDTKAYEIYEKYNKGE